MPFDGNPAASLIGDPGASLPSPVAFTARDPGFSPPRIASLAAGSGASTYSTGTSEAICAWMRAISSRRGRLRFDTTMRAGTFGPRSFGLRCQVRAIVDPPAHNEKNTDTSSAHWARGRESDEKRKRGEKRG